MILSLASSSIVDALLIGRPVISLARSSFMVGESDLPFTQMQTWSELPRLIESWRHVRIPEQKVLAYFFSFQSNTTASFDDTEELPDWPDAKRAALKEIPWYIPGQEGLVTIGAKISAYIAEYDSQESGGS